MKNILIAVFLLGFMGMSNSIAAQASLHVLKEYMPCNNFPSGAYTVYLEGTPTNASQYAANSRIRVTSGAAVALNAGGNPVSTGTWVPVVKLPYAAANSTERVYAIRVTGSSSFTVEEYYNYNSGGAVQSATKTKVITPQVLTRTPSQVRDVEILESDLCAGTMKVRCDASSLGPISHYKWYITNLTTNNTTYLGATRSKEASLNHVGITNASASGSFQLRIESHNKCGVETYTEDFTVAGSLTVIQLPHIERRNTGSYCPGRRNEFYITGGAPGLEYRWRMIGGAGEVVSGLDLTSFYPDFGNAHSMGSFILMLEYKVGCGAWNSVPSATFMDFNVQYSSCTIIHGKTATDQNQVDALEELSSVGSETTTTKQENTAGSKLSTLDNMDNAITAFPNPTTGVLELKSENEKIEAVSVYNVTGVLVTQQLNVNATNPRLDLGELPQGMYVVNIQTATTNKTIQVIKK